jgi:hypothetical protein
LDTLSGVAVRTLLSGWIVLITSGPCTAQVVENTEKAEGFVALFNGKDLDGWKRYDVKNDVWSAAEGMIVCTGKAGGGWLGTNRDYANFEIRLEYRLSPGGNSGVYIRAPQKGWISRVGMEIQILDDFHANYAKLEPYQYTGSIYHVVGPSKRVTKKAGEWNKLTIRADGKQVVVILNGTKIVDADLDRYLKDPKVAKEHPGLARKTGRIGLQSHTDRVEYRNLRIKELK